jgi:hypothetical protein
VPRFKARRGTVRVTFDEAEAQLLRQLVDEMRQLLDGNSDADPALERLFPAAYEDPVQAQEYRELADDSLRREKQLALEQVSQALAEDGEATVAIGRDELDVWLPVITDLRLTIGVRIDVDEEKMSTAPDASDPEAFPLSVVHWLGWITEELLRGTG